MIIAVIVAVFTSTIQMLQEGTEKKFNRLVATQDIDQGKVITSDMLKAVEIGEIEGQENAIYRKNKNDNNKRNSVDDTEVLKDALAYVANAIAGGKTEVEAEKEAKAKFNIDVSIPKDDLWAVGKIAKEKIYKGEILISDKVVHSEDIIAEETRLYAIPFDSSNTGGYNITLGNKVDICVLYTDNYKTISEYQNLANNKVIDIVLAEKTIADIRDENGNSRKESDGVLPGYICFNLTYEEINQVELAKRQGTLFIGTPENYYKNGSQSATFMPGQAMPTF